ncbi:MAG: MtrB/PioB family decaheme-associated outer membrane protein [Gammaproteobacteria bacterium]|nr:MtrB/PioB family decaheme-associated outer membrane protein [Gammaproteobacteria bacterium]MBU1979867.1 MtrB/PioB family decaheme-associated outer membrane protein [Gammaproteobacteria bacterium]
MKNTKQIFTLTTISAALLVAYGPAFADEAEMTQLIKPESSVSVGIGNWSGDRPQQGIYDGMRENGLYGLLDADIVKRDDATGTWTTFNASNLGTDAFGLGAGYERQGNFGVRLRYDVISRDNPYTFNTATQGIGSTNLTTPATANPARSETTLGVKRKQSDLDLVKHIMPGLTLNINFKNEDKEGTRQWGRGGAAEFSVEPINATTRQLEIKLNHIGERLQLSGGYYGSWYDNANSLVKTQLSTGAGLYYLTLPLDNQAHQLFLDGGYSFTPATRGTFKIQHTRATQNEHLPTADIAGLALASAPTNLNGRIDTNLIQLGLTSRPTHNLSVVANLRYRNENDKTPEALYVTGSTIVHNTPYDYKSLVGKLEGTYRLPDNYSLIAGIDQSSQDRTVPVGNVVAGVDTERYVPFRAKIDETTYRLQLRRSLTDTVNGSLAYLHSKRDGSTLSQTEASESDEINPIHIADRKRDKWRMTADWTPVDTLSLQFNYETSKDDYGHDATREYGLRDGDASMVSVDAAYTLNDDWKLTAFYSHDKTTANQYNGRWTNGTGVHEADRVSHLKEVGESIGLGLRGQASAKTRIGADLQWTETRADYPSDITYIAGATPAYPVGNNPLPNITNQIMALKLFGEYSIDKTSDVRIDMIHERWKTDDWSWLFADGTPFTYGTSTDGTQVLSKPKQTSTFLSVRYIYKFQ